MSTPNPNPGPDVEDGESLYRRITTPAWWVASENRPSSAAFRHPDFSADVASIAASPEHTLGHLPPGSGVVSFPCGEAKQIGFAIRLEPDPSNPDNLAHANVYSGSSPGQRKKMAQRLVALCTVVVPPRFG